MCVLRSVSNPNESMAGMKALTVYSGEPGTGASWVTWPLSTQTNQNKLNNKFLSINFARQVQCEEYNNFLIKSRNLFSLAELKVERIPTTAAYGMLNYTRSRREVGKHLCCTIKLCVKFFSATKNF